MADKPDKKKQKTLARIEDGVKALGTEATGLRDRLAETAGRLESLEESHRRWGRLEESLRKVERKTLSSAMRTLILVLFLTVIVLLLRDLFREDPAEAIGTRLTEIETRVEERIQNVKPSLDRLESRLKSTLAGVESEVTSLAQESRNTRQSLAAISTLLAKGATTEDAERLGKEIAQIASRLIELDLKMSARLATTAEELRQLRADNEEMRAAVRSLDEKISARPEKRDVVLVPRAEPPR
jgi:chromosome segregation ATPase